MMDSGAKTCRMEMMSVNAKGGGGHQFMDASSSSNVEAVEKDNVCDSKTIIPNINHHVMQNKKSKKNNNDNNNNGIISIAERRAAKCGFNASSINGVGGPPSPPYFTLPPGISPSTLLDSPIMLPNAQAQLSPTTGTFPFPSPNHETLNLKLKIATNVGASSIDSVSSTSKAATQLPHSLFINNNNIRVIENEVVNGEFGYCDIERDFQEMSDCKQKDCVGVNEVDGDAIVRVAASQRPISLAPSTNQPVIMSSIPQTITINDHSSNIIGRSDQMVNTSTNPDKIINSNDVQKEGGGGASNNNNNNVAPSLAKYAEDGYYWRKYGQKHVKGSEFPRSYFKCTNTSCLVKKKVERSHDGHITEIVYKGSHNHPKPQQLKRIGEEENVIVDVTAPSASSAAPPDTAILYNHHHHEGLEGGGLSTSSTSFLSDFSDPMSTRSDTNQEFSSTFGGHDDDHQNCDVINANNHRIGENEASPDNISTNDEDDDTSHDQSEPKKRKRDEMFTTNETTVSRSTREPRVVVQIESDIDILDDGYRWRKYGQKVVKGNPNPRSYYKCTTPGCPVRKHVERAATDIKCVVTTYEGKHNHEIPSSTKNAGTSDHVSNNNMRSSAAPSPRGQLRHHDHHQSSKFRQHQDHHHLPIYMAERKPPILNYNELMMGHAPATNTTFGGGSSSSSSSLSSMYHPLPFPPFPSMPYHSNFLVNANHHHIKTSPTYPTNFSNLNYAPSMLPEFMSSSIPSPPINHHRVPNHHVASLGSGNNYNSLVNKTLYAPIKSPNSISNTNIGQDITTASCNNINPKILKPKEERKDEYEAVCLSNIPNHLQHHQGNTSF